MLVSFLCWGVAMPRLVRIGFGAERLIRWGWPVRALVMSAAIGLGPSAGAAWWALWCVTTSVVTLSQPAIAQAFPAARAGRALSAFNLVIFMGVFVNQWGIGLVIDALGRAGWSQAACFRAAFGLAPGRDAGQRPLVLVRRRDCPADTVPAVPSIMVCQPNRSCPAS